MVVMGTSGGADWATVVTTLIVGVLAAGAALGGVWFTQRTERQKAAEDRAAQATVTAATLRANLHGTQSQNLRTALAEHLSLTGRIDPAYRVAMSSGAPWPGEMNAAVEREDVMYNLIRLYLDVSRRGHRQLLSDVQEVRNSTSDILWTTRRDAVINSATRALKEDSEEILMVLSTDLPRQKVTSD